jgi:hypothetical protein
MRLGAISAAVSAVLFAGMASAVPSSPAEALVSTPKTVPPAKSCDVAAGDVHVEPNLAAGRAALADRNFPLAAAHLKPLAEAGNATAGRLYGSLLLKDNCGAPPDKIKGEKLLIAAAAARDVPAASQLGFYYMQGKVLLQNDAEAFRWLKFAAEAGDDQAAVNLGVLYGSGRGVAQDKRQGLQWLVKGAEAGRPMALLDVAGAYMSGAVLPKDTKRAYFWACAAMQRAGDLPYPARLTVQKRKTAIAILLSVDEANKIEKKSKAWKPGKGSLQDVLDDMPAAKPSDALAGK